MLPRCVENCLIALFAVFALFSFPAHSPHALTLEEALSLSKETLPAYKASKAKALSSEALYKASLSPYLPSLDATATQERHYDSIEEFDRSLYDVTLSYTLFDGGLRRANRNIARLNLDIDREEIAKTLLQLQFDVKTAFYSTIARQRIVEERKIQLHDAKKDHEIAEGRYKFGVAKLSDVLQASVRLEQARFNLVQGEGELNKTLSDLNSLVGRPLDAPYDLQGSLDFELELPPFDVLSKAAMERPEVKQGESAVEISKSNKAIETSSFYPAISANASYNRIEGGLAGVSAADDKVVGITATWNIFELGKFYRRRSADFDISTSRENLSETVRRLLLELRRAYEDYLTASRNVAVAEEQLKQAEHNYSQAFGEYKVGKSDILSLVQAESFLANAREQLTTSKLNHTLSRVLLERATGVENIVTLQRLNGSPSRGTFRQIPQHLPTPACE